jgi:hypothetical protein
MMSIDADGVARQGAFDPSKIKFTDAGIQF